MASLQQQRGFARLQNIETTQPPPEGSLPNRMNFLISKQKSYH